MASIKAYLAFVVGCVLTFGGGYQSFANIGSMNTVYLWGAVAVVGMFPLVYGISNIISDIGESEEGERGGAPPKT